MRTLLFFLLLPVLAFAQTNVSGFISTNTTWTLAGSPYVVVGNILVNPGVTLIIKPGVTVKFDANKILQVKGTLNAIGTVNSKITFTGNTTSPSPGFWKNILFDAGCVDFDSLSGAGCILRNCIIEYAGGDGAIKIISNVPLIDSCIIRHNLSRGIHADNQGLTPIGTPNHILKITNNQILNNKGDGVRAICTSNGVLIITGNLLENNNGGINHWYGDYQITRNIVCGHTGNAIDGTGGKKGSLISKNLFINNDLPAQMNVNLGIGSGERVVISKNIIAENKAYTSPCINVQGGDSVFFVKNQIVNNSGPTILFIYGAGNNGITIQNNTIAHNNVTNEKDYWSAGDTIPSLVTLHQYPKFIYNNVFSQTTNFLPCATIDNSNPQTSQAISIPNNYLSGAITTSAVDSLLWDWFDNNDFGLLSYSPYLTKPDTVAPISPPSNISKTDLGGGNIQVTWSPNPESDLAGYKLYWNQINCYSFANSIDAGNTTSYSISGLSINDKIAITAYDNQFDGIDDQFDGNESWFSITDSTWATVGASSINYNPKAAIFPNPFSTQLTFALSDNEQTTVSLYNLFGQQILRQTFTNSTTLNTEQLISGIYFYELRNSKGVVKTGKVVRE